MTRSRTFSRASRQLHLFAWSFDWFTGLSVPFGIRLSVFFGFGLDGPHLKTPLVYLCKQDIRSQIIKDILFLEKLGVLSVRIADCNKQQQHRQSDVFIPRYKSKTYVKHSLRYLGPRLWGKLLPDVRCAKI